MLVPAGAAVRYARLHARSSSKAAGSVSRYFIYARRTNGAGRR